MPATDAALPFSEIPRAPLSRILQTLVKPKAQRYAMREMTADFYRDFGPVVIQGRGRFSTVNLFGPDANRFVLLDRDRIFSARKPWMLIMGEIFPNGLLLRDGVEHLHHRKIMLEAFKRPILRDYADRMNPAIEAGLENWGKESSSIKAFDSFKALTLDMAMTIFVGVDLGPDADKTNRAFEAMVAASMPGFRHKLPFGRYYEGLQGRSSMLSFLESLLPKKRTDPGGDIFSRLAHARTEEGDTFADQDVLDHMVFLMMAAHDTTTSTLTSMTYELAKHPEWQDRLREESLAFGDTPPGFEDLDGLEAMTWAMRETLRLYPPLPVIPRVANEDFEWQGYRIPAGTMVVVAPIHTHYMPEWWTGPTRFDPERFAPARAEDKRHSHSWIPFGGGPHMCLGRRFGEAQVRLILHQMLRRFRWSVPEGYEMPVQQAPISKPVDGLPIQIERL